MDKMDTNASSQEGKTGKLEPGELGCGGVTGVEKIIVLEWG